MACCENVLRTRTFDRSCVSQREQAAREKAKAVPAPRRLGDQRPRCTTSSSDRALGSPAIPGTPRSRAWLGLLASVSEPRSVQTLTGFGADCCEALPPG